MEPSSEIQLRKLEFLAVEGAVVAAFAAEGECASFGGHGSSVASVELSPAPRSRTWSPLLHVRQAGSGDAEPLLLIHGLGTSQVIWDAVVPGLARTRRVVTIDLPGFGRSAPAGPGFELGAVADRVARGLAAHGVSGPLDVVGHSLGGAVALTLAVDRPRLVRRLVLVAPAGLHARTLPRPLIQGALGVGAEGRFAASAKGGSPPWSRGGSPPVVAPPRSPTCAGAGGCCWRWRSPTAPSSRPGRPG